MDLDYGRNIMLRFDNGEVTEFDILTYPISIGAKAVYMYLTSKNHLREAIPLELICQTQGITKPSATKYLKELEKNGLLEINRNSKPFIYKTVTKLPEEEAN